MPKITFYIDGNPVKFEGTVQEVTDFLKSVETQKISLTPSDKESAKLQKLDEEKNEIRRVRKNLPSVEQVADYILSQPNYKHSTFGIQEHFFGRTFKARGPTESLYHDFLHLATDARKFIEKKHRGSFSFSLNLGRHKIYHWMANNRG